MKRALFALPLCLALWGCPGVVESIAGHTNAGGGLATSKHAQGFACPDFSAQGALQVTGLSASCSDAPGGAHSEYFTVQSVDPNQALALAFTAQSQQNAQLMQALGQLLPLLTTAAGAAVGVPISPARPPMTPINPAPIVLIPPPAGS